MVWTSPGIISNVKLGLDLKGGFEILYTAVPVDENQEMDQELLREAARSLQMRADAKGISEPEIYPEGEDRIRVRLAGVENQDEVRQIMKKPAELTFRSNNGCEDPSEFCKIELNGSDFVEGAADVVFKENTNEPLVSIQVKDKDKFKEVTQRLLNNGYRTQENILAIYLDNEIISLPFVGFVSTDGTATITGQETFEEAEELAGIINLGALPVVLTEKYTQSVGASLGELSLQQTITAGIIGFVLILIFMLGFYRVPGIIACVTLTVYTWMLLLVFYWMNATLTLPGIAAFVLGIGMAVDANIITYERIREEIRSGKSILSSLRAGSRNSLRTIMDANITTILAGLVLYYIGTGSIQGFALTLILSILVSIITNVFLSRLLLHLLIRANIAKKPAYYGVKEAEISEL
ncbi:protein translocase subunit SecD [Chengkuizengella axinellae]|uniref:Protein translocase subunit SecD n=1 Tax=Chengkuizengella axinellae TaxID=3064388 RepID=A0ABT9ITU5_9BACL|nr:protein translocase subunit SecD [Chengkuizengella sp. 2205SS18-9]MDP5272770.1 protein translocase subunit SecD [Chengkuizengella sp. 2205SS18-9]